MKTTSEELTVFVQVVENGSFSRAASNSKFCGKSRGEKTRRKIRREPNQPHHATAKTNRRRFAYVCF